VTRVVSLVPSVTETLLRLGVVPVACTRFCDQPGIATVGGTKNPDLDAITALAPDLVVVNDEENRKEDADALVARGVRLHDMSPRTVADVGPAVTALADAAGAAPPDAFTAEQWSAWLSEERSRALPRSASVFVPVWRRPWMTMNGDTYGSSILGLLGVTNVYADHADRYPTVTLDDVAARVPDLVLLPSEPYEFKPRHAVEIAAALPDAAVEFVDGRDLFWWGARTIDAVDRLRTTLGLWT
jgi:ABC-type Fe3+-hydroxamate transport system substrate-binding protein